MLQCFHDRLTVTLPVRSSEHRQHERQGCRKRFEPLAQRIEQRSSKAIITVGFRGGSPSKPLMRVRIPPDASASVAQW